MGTYNGGLREDYKDQLGEAGQTIAFGDLGVLIGFSYEARLEFYN
jgi:hypothetical protein